MAPVPVPNETFFTISGGAPLAGTVAMTNGVAALVGTGTAFLTALRVGNRVQFSNQLGTYYTILSIASNTSAQLTAVFSGATATVGISAATNFSIRPNGVDDWDNLQTCLNAIAAQPKPSALLVPRGQLSAGQFFARYQLDATAVDGTIAGAGSEATVLVAGTSTERFLLLDTVDQAAQMPSGWPSLFLVKPSAAYPVHDFRAQGMTIRGSAFAGYAGIWFNPNASNLGLEAAFFVTGINPNPTVYNVPMRLFATTATLVTGALNLLNVVVRSAVDGGGTLYASGVDYTLDAAAGTIARIGGAGIADGGTVYVSFNNANNLTQVGRTNFSLDDVIVEGVKITNTTTGYPNTNIDTGVVYSGGRPFATVASSASATFAPIITNPVYTDRQIVLTALTPMSLLGSANLAFSGTPTIRSAAGGGGVLYTAAVRATGSIQAITGALLVDAQTFTLNDGANPATVFEFDLNGGGVTPGNIAVVYTAGDSAATVAAAIAAAINGVGATLTIDATRIAGDTLVTLRNSVFGIAGNVAITDTVVDAGFVVVGMAGGIAGDYALDAALGTIVRTAGSTIGSGSTVFSTFTLAFQNLLWQRTNSQAYVPMNGISSLVDCVFEDVTAAYQRRAVEGVPAAGPYAFNANAAARSTLDVRRCTLRRVGLDASAGIQPFVEDANTGQYLAITECRLEDCAGFVRLSVSGVPTTFTNRLAGWTTTASSLLVADNDVTMSDAFAFSGFSSPNLINIARNNGATVPASPVENQCAIVDNVFRQSPSNPITTARLISNARAGKSLIARNLFEGAANAQESISLANAGTISDIFGNEFSQMGQLAGRSNIRLGAGVTGCVVIADQDTLVENQGGAGNTVLGGLISPLVTA